MVATHAGGVEKCRWNLVLVWWFYGGDAFKDEGRVQMESRPGMVVSWWRRTHGHWKSAGGISSWYGGFMAETRSKTRAESRWNLVLVWLFHGGDARTGTGKVQVESRPGMVVLWRSIEMG